MNRTDKMLLKEFSVLERKDNDNKIIIWPQLPFWLYLNPPTVDLINNINNKNLNEIISYLNKKYDIKPCEDEIINLINILHDASALKFQGEQDILKDDSINEYTIHYMTINITNACNLFCSHCYINASNKNNQYMSSETAKNIIDKISPYAIKACRINISGGEALLNKDLFRIIEYFESKGYTKLNLVTNGTLVTREIAKKFSKFNNLTIQVSLDGAKKETHEKIRGYGNFDKTIQGIKYLVEQGNRVYLSPILTKDLFNEIEDYFELGKNLGIKAIFLQPIICVGRAKENKLERVNDAAVFKKLVEMYEKDASLINYIPGTLEAMYMANIKLLVKMVYCGTGSATLAIQPNGDCYPCPNTIIDSMKCGNIVEQDFGEIWRNSDVLNTLRHIRIDTNLNDKCKKCEVRYFCGGGCRGQAFQNTGDIHALSTTCDYEKEQLMEMLWTAASKPNLFENEVTRQLQLYKEREDQTINIINNLKERASDF